MKDNRSWEEVASDALRPATYDNWFAAKNAVLYAMRFAFDAGVKQERERCAAIANDIEVEASKTANKADALGLDGLFEYARNDALTAFDIADKIRKG
jgi:hypothetical protein